MAEILLTGDLELDGVGVSDEVTGFTVTVTQDEVDVPATLSNRWGSKRGGRLSASITINFLQSEDATSVSEILWDSILTGDGTVDFRGKVTDDADNSFEGTFLATSNEMGGDAYSVGAASLTFPVVGALVKASSGS